MYMLIFLRKSDFLGCAVLLCLVVCLTLLASFFLPSFSCLSLKHILVGVSLQIVCQTIAVVLHYSFLVTFMWMLMEGVVLYVALVKVFVTKPQHYIITFTVISYGKPIYMHMCTSSFTVRAMYIYIGLRD